ncbi:MAG: TraR/DksA C4-type zinc finger protein [Candidatus Binatia bacterium]
MKAMEIEAFRRLLLEQRRRLFRAISSVEADLHEIAEKHESELEEAAHEERTARLLARLNDRGRGQLQEIDRALFRIENQKYGRCEGCGRPIPPGRLAILPATPYCRDCAERTERPAPAELEAEEAPQAGPVPPDYSLLTGRELEEAIREHLREDGRVDIEELRIVCRRGVVYVDGSVPSESQHQILLHTVSDVLGLTEIVDRVRVKEILWEREDRYKAESPQDERPWEEVEGTEDVTEVHDEGVDFVPPVAPPPDEE